MHVKSSLQKTATSHGVPGEQRSSTRQRSPPGPQSARLFWQVKAFSVPSGQQVHGRLLRFRQSRLVSHFRPRRHRRGRSTSVPAEDVSTGTTYTAPASAAARLSRASLLNSSRSVIPLSKRRPLPGAKAAADPQPTRCALARVATDARGTTRVDAAVARWAALARLLVARDLAGAAAAVADLDADGPEPLARRRQHEAVARLGGVAEVGDVTGRPLLQALRVRRADSRPARAQRRPARERLRRLLRAADARPIPPRPAVSARLARSADLAPPRPLDFCGGRRGQDGRRIDRAGQRRLPLEQHFPAESLLLRHRCSVAVGPPPTRRRPRGLGPTLHGVEHSPWGQQVSRQHIPGGQPLPVSLSHGG
jgi:hypothetical protein